jgi:hypothetical protein
MVVKDTVAKYIDFGAEGTSTNESTTSVLKEYPQDPYLDGSPIFKHVGICHNTYTQIAHQGKETLENREFIGNLYLRQLSHFLARQSFTLASEVLDMKGFFLDLCP